MDIERKEQIATELFEAEKDAVEVDMFTAMHPDLDIDTAYEIQQLLLEKKIAAGETRVTGRKLGLTSEAKMKQMNVNEPCFGTLLANMAHSEGETLSLDPFIHPKIEPEIAFIFKEPLEGTYISVTDVMNATGVIAPALEVIDSRYRDFKFTLPDVIADNASSSRYIIGNQFHDPKQFDLSLMGMVFQKNGEIVSTGTGAAVMGHPARPIAWMANKLIEMGQSIQAGDVVLSGALGEAMMLEAGDVISLSFDGIGSVGVSVCHHNRYTEKE